jgi:hypothetical protein
VSTFSKRFSHQKENKSEQALQIIGHVVADSMQMVIYQLYCQARRHW